MRRSGGGVSVQKDAERLNVFMVPAQKSERLCIPAAVRRKRFWISLEFLPDRRSELFLSWNLWRKRRS